MIYFSRMYLTLKTFPRMQTLTHIHTHTHTHTHTPTNFMKSSDYFSLLTLSFWFYVIKPSDELYCFTTEESWMVIRFFTLNFIRVFHRA